MQKHIFARYLHRFGVQRGGGGTGQRAQQTIGARCSPLVGLRHSSADVTRPSSSQPGVDRFCEYADFRMLAVGLPVLGDVSAHRTLSVVFLQTQPQT